MTSAAPASPENAASQPHSRDTSTAPSPTPLSETDTLLKSYKASLLLLLTTYHTHFRSLGYIKDATLDLLARTVSARTVQLTVRDSRARTAIGSDVKVWDELVDVFRNAIGSLDGRCYAAIDGVAAAAEDPDGLAPYDGPSSNVIVANSATLVADLRRLDVLLAIARNVLTAGEKVQNLAAQTGFDREVCALVNLAVKVTARGYDGDGAQAEEDQFLEVSNGFKKLLITSLQFLSNLVTMNERLKLMLWVELFDSDVDHGALTDLPAAPGEEEKWNKANKTDQRAIADNESSNDPNIDTPQPSSTAERKRSAPKKPSRPMTPYLLFLSANRSRIRNELKGKYPEPSNKQILQEGTRRWNVMPEREKEVWRNYFEESLEKYEQDLEAWRAAGGEDPTKQESKSSEEEEDHLRALQAEGLEIPGSSSDEEPPPRKARPIPGTKPFPATFDILSNPPPRSLDSNFGMTETADDGIKKLEEGKIQLLKRLDHQEHSAPLKFDLPSGESPLASPASPVQEQPSDEAAASKDEEQANFDEAEVDNEEDEDYMDSADGEEEVSSDEDEEEDDEDYAIPGEDGRGLLTDVPLILGPNEIEVLPMIIMSGIVVDLNDGEPPSDTLMNMYTIRCHLLLAQENGRNLLRELLIFVAAWDLREEELYFKFMVKIIEAILLNGLMPFAYGAFKESKDIISPAQAVIMKLLTKIFHSRQAYTSTALKENPIALLSAGRSSSTQDPPQSQVASRPLRPDIQTVHFLFSEFRTTIIPQICALIFLQGQIRAGHAQLDDFPLNLWDMERMYEGVYQYLEFFAILTDHDVWKERMAEWEVVSELVTLLRELEAAIPKKGLGSGGGPMAGQMSRANYDPPQDAASASPSTPSPAPVAVERPYDVTSPPAETAALRAKSALEAEALKMANHLQSISSMSASLQSGADGDGSMAPPPTPPGAPPAPLHDEPADFEWRNLKKLCVLVLSSLVWKNKKLQDQVRNFGGINVLLSCCSGVGGVDEHNPYIREHAIMCLRFLIEGNDECAAVVRGLSERGHAQQRARANAAAKTSQQSGDEQGETSADGDDGIPRREEGSRSVKKQEEDAANEEAEEAAEPEGEEDEEGFIPVPAEVLDHRGYETFMDAKGQVGLRRKDPHSQGGYDSPQNQAQNEGYFGAEASEPQKQSRHSTATKESQHPAATLQIPPPKNPAQLPEWMQMVMKSLPKADGVMGSSSSGGGGKK